MLIQEEIIIEGQAFIRSYSDRHFYIKGGEPKGLYVSALDPKELKRRYVETTIPIEEDEG